MSKITNTAWEHDAYVVYHDGQRAYESARSAEEALAIALEWRERHDSQGKDRISGPPAMEIGTMSVKTTRVYSKTPGDHVVGGHMDPANGRMTFDGSSAKLTHSKAAGELDITIAHAMQLGNRDGSTSSLKCRTVKEARQAATNFVRQQKRFESCGTYQTVETRSVRQAVVFRAEQQSGVRGPHLVCRGKQPHRRHHA